MIPRGMIVAGGAAAVFIAFPEGFIDVMALSAGAIFFWAGNEIRSLRSKDGAG
ncbi:MAG: hypothetical protein HC767_10140, partial [Akkermansiaceae bacterium]|nr:hypothetical protein [Akkermansiaceae bacterium]